MACELSFLKVECDLPQPPVKPMDPEWNLADIAAIFMEDIWRPYILDKSPAPAPDSEQSPFRLAAWAVQPYWHFIFSIKLLFIRVWNGGQSWCVHDFCFGTKDVQLAKMDRLAIRYTKQFGESVDVKKATNWLHQIIKTSRDELQFRGYNLEVFDQFYSVVPNATDPLFTEYLIYLRQNGHQDHLKSWYDHGGLLDGTKSLERLHNLKEFRWGNYLQELEVYMLTVKAVCAFDVSARTDREMCQTYSQMFSSCVFFVCAWFKHRRDSKREFIIAQLEAYRSPTPLKDTELAAKL